MLPSCGHSWELQLGNAPVPRGNFTHLLKMKKKKKDTLKGISLLNKIRLSDVYSNFKVTRKEICSSVKTA